jgi:integrase
MPQVQVAPLLKDDMVLLLAQAKDDLKGHRDKALLLLGFCAALRRSELAAVRVEDLEFTSQGIILTLPRSKTDQTGQGRKIGIPKGRGGRICPVGSVGLWMKQSGIHSGPLFRAITKGGVLSDQVLSNRAVANIVKDYAQKAGLDPARHSGHSLRAGLATSAAQHGVSSWKIRAQTGHRSDAMLARYIRDGDIFSDNAAALF